MQESTADQVTKEEKYYCQCGCGGEIIIKKYHRWYGIPKFIQGHMSKVHELHPMRGKIHSSETKEKISQSRIGKYTGADNSFFGKHHSEEMKLAQSEMRKKQYAIKDANPFYGKKHSDETKEIIRKRAIERCANPEYRKMISDKTKEGMTPEVIARLSIINKETANNPVWKARKSEMEKMRWKYDKNFLAKVKKSRSTKPNKAECKLRDILNEKYPGGWKFTGDFSFMINGKNPDFVNYNGQKKLIELFGDYWHEGENPQDRIDVFKPFGYDTLVIWEHELKDLDSLKYKLERFCA